MIAESVRFDVDQKEWRLFIFVVSFEVVGLSYCWQLVVVGNDLGVKPMHEDVDYIQGVSICNGQDSQIAGSMSCNSTITTPSVIARLCHDQLCCRRCASTRSCIPECWWLSILLLFFCVCNCYWWTDSAPIGEVLKLRSRKRGFIRKQSGSQRS